MIQTRQGYYHHPTVRGKQIVFVCEDDLWSVLSGDGIPHRLTSNLGMLNFPRLSPDGRWLAFCSREEGQPDVYFIPAEGGEMKRLTFLGTVRKIVGWSHDSKDILFLSTHRQSIPMDQPQAFSIPLTGGYPQNFLACPTINLSLKSAGTGIVIGRNNSDNARWKRYRGGTAGEIWIDHEENGHFVKLPLPQGNPNAPMWIDGRIYFVSDHDGVGNLFSCTCTGKDLRAETNHRNFYVRHPSTDYHSIVYQAGADIYRFDVNTRESKKVDIQWRSPRVQTQRKFSSVTRSLESCHLHPKGHSMAITARGKLFSFAHWEGAVLQHGQPNGVRHRLARWLHNGEQIIAMSDHEDGEEKLVLFENNPSEEPIRTFEVMAGRIQSLVSSPVSSEIAVTTSRLDLWIVDAASGNRRLLDSNDIAEIRQVTFSPDGRWLAYRKTVTEKLKAIYLCELESGTVHQITQPVLYDFHPHFDPDGRYLYFLSARILNPVNDSIQFTVSFPSAVKPYLVTLRKDLTSPFIASPAAPGEEISPHLAFEKSNGVNGKIQNGFDANNKTLKPIQIDLEGIQNRIVEFPVKEGLYRQIRGIKDKVVFTSYPVRGRADLGDSSASDDDDSRGTLWVYDFIQQKLEVIASDVSEIQTANEAKTLAYRSGRRLRVLKAGEKPGENGNGLSNRKNGWLDLSRVKCSIEPSSEWRQMFREAWRLQREFFWTKNMSGVDWQVVYKRYAPLLERIATRFEFSDLVWEMQGELGTSHAYEVGGDYRHPPYYTIGRLGVDFKYDAERSCYILDQIHTGDIWLKDSSSPLSAPGVNVKVGDILLAIGGVQLSETLTPGQLLANQANQEVVLTVQGQDTDSAPRHITVKTLRSEYPVRYREWVERNASKVAEETDGKIGYLHIPDMSTRGLIEFHRYFLAQTDKAGLIVDVRYNGGGNVSSILLDKLLRRPLGYDVQRWGRPEPYPQHSIRGPIIALTNEFAGSDGDIFCHSFKLLKIGPLIGKRTWGGVIGIDNRYTLTDGGRTTQPQYSFWFKDVKWQVENYGVQPDIEVDFDPGAHLNGEDPQLERTIAEALRLLEKNGTELPSFDDRPHLALPL